MNATIQSVNFTADQKLVNFIQKRLDKLEQFNDDIVNGSVFLKVEPDHERGNKKSRNIGALKRSGTNGEESSPNL